MNISFSRKRKQPTKEGQMPVRYAPGKRTIANLKWRLTLLIVLSPFLYFLGKVILSMFIAPASGFVMLDIQRYQSSVSGVVRELYVEVGKQVKKNDLLAVLQNHDLEAKIEEVTLLLNLPATEMQTEDSTTEAYLLNQINLAEEALEHQQKRYNDIDFLFKQGAATLSEQASAHNQLNSARSRLVGAEYDYQQFLNKIGYGIAISGSSKERLELENKLNQLEQSKERLSIRAINAGKVTEVLISEGQVVSEGAPLLAVASDDNATIVAYVSPKHVERVQSGSVVSFELPSGRRIQGLIKHMPGVTGRLPSYLSSPMLGRQRMIVVYLKPLEPLPPSEMVDGLPVEVYTPAPFRTMIERFLAMF